MITLHDHGCGRSTKVSEITEKLIKRAKDNNLAVGPQDFLRLIYVIMVDGVTTSRLINGRWRRLYGRRR